MSKTTSKLNEYEVLRAYIRRVIKRTPAEHRNTGDIKSQMDASMEIH